MKLRVLPERFGILKLLPPQPFPNWMRDVPIYFIAQTEDEYSIVCPQEFIPGDMAYDADWRCLRVDGELAYDEIGVVARVSKPLADAGMSLFLMSTHDRDYVFVAQNDLQRAIDVYQSSGFEIATAATEP